jgi:hypothetical protein
MAASVYSGNSSGRFSAAIALAVYHRNGGSRSRVRREDVCDVMQGLLFFTGSRLKSYIDNLTA